jgi:hypothetical protein
MENRLAQEHAREDASARAAALIAQALTELQKVSSNDVADARAELKAGAEMLGQLAASIERHMKEEQEQRLAIGAQLTALTSSLDGLVTNLHSLSTMIGDLLQHMAVAATIPQPSRSMVGAAEPAFQPGGEGLSLTITGVQGFQALMEVQKALASHHKVSHASVERFQEGDSRLLVMLNVAATAGEIADALTAATGQALVIEESKPELSRLKLKIVPVA